jgi:hypothetical protein
MYPDPPRPSAHHRSNDPTLISPVHGNTAPRSRAGSSEGLQPDCPPLVDEGPPPGAQTPSLRDAPDTRPRPPARRAPGGARRKPRTPARRRPVGPALRAGSTVTFRISEGNGLRKPKRSGGISRNGAFGRCSSGWRAVPRALRVRPARCAGQAHHHRPPRVARLKARDANPGIRPPHRTNCQHRTMGRT